LVWAAALVCLAPIGCGSETIVGERAAGGRSPQNLVVARASDALLLDPARVADDESVEITEQLYDRLLHWKPGSSEIVPGLAMTWQVDATGRVWTFQLRDGVTFHDGTPMDADAVVFSFERQRDPQHPFHRTDFQYWNNQFRNIQRVEKVAPMIVRITIDRPYAPFEANVAMFCVSIVSPTAVAKWGDAFADNPVGTGPFVFERWDKGERIVMRKNPSYWGGAPQFDRLVFEVIRDPRQRLVALESGAVDVASAILPAELQYVELHPALTLHRAPSNNIAYLAMNMSRPPFDDQRIRRAINHAINKEPIVHMAYQGLAVPADGPLPPDQWGHHVPQMRYRYDPDQAKELIAAAVEDGVLPAPGSPLAPTYRLFVPSTPRPYISDPERVARTLVANLADVGLPVELVLQPYAEHRRAVQAGEHDLAVFGWVGDNGDPDNFLYVLFDRDTAEAGRASNIAFYRDGETHDLLVRAQEAPSRAQREDLYARVQDRLSEHAPWVPLAHTKVVYAARRDVGNVRLMPTGHIVYAMTERLQR
jgi:peptide/nickel transport system substrate-binding protein